MSDGLDRAFAALEKAIETGSSSMMLYARHYRAEVENVLMEAERARRQRGSQVTDTEAIIAVDAEDGVRRRLKYLQYDELKRLQSAVNYHIENFPMQDAALARASEEGGE